MHMTRLRLTAIGFALTIGAAACGSSTTTSEPADATSEPADDLEATDSTAATSFEEAAVWGADPSGVQFDGPNGLTIDAEGRVYSTEFQGGHLRRFSPEGELDFEAGGSGAAPGSLVNPIGVAVGSGGTIYVSESGSSRVSQFDANGEFLSAWGESGSGPGQFLSAMGIAISEQGEVFVADFGNSRLQVFDGDGGYLREWGMQGSAPGEFVNPIGVQIGPDANVWVVDSGNARVQVFSPEGDVVRVFDDVGPQPEIISINSAGDFYVSSPWGDSQVRRFSADGEMLGFLGEGLSGPHGTATGPTGAVYVADTMNGVIRVFTPS